MGSVDSPNLYAGFGWMPHAVTDPLGEAIRIHMFTKNSGLSEEQQQRLAGLVVRYFKRLPWAGEADVTIGIVPHSFEDYESLKGPFIRARSDDSDDFVINQSQALET